MLKIEVYPVMSGMLVTMHGICTNDHVGEGRCHPVTVSQTAGVDDIERHGPLDAAYNALSQLAREYGEVWSYAQH